MVTWYAEEAPTACRTEGGHDEDDDDDDNDDDEEEDETDKKDEKHSQFESGDEETRLLHVCNGEEDCAGPAKRTRRKRGRWREGADGGNLGE